MKKTDWFAEILGDIWVVTWFLAIWINEYRWKLFWTGLFCFSLAVINLSIKKEKKKNEKTKKKE